MGESQLILFHGSLPCAPKRAELTPVSNPNPNCYPTPPRPGARWKISKTTPQARVRTAQDGDVIKASVLLEYHAEFV